MFKDALLKLIDRTKIDDEPEILRQFSEDISFVEPCTPTLVVYPENKEDVKEIVKLANEYHTPLIPVSSGPPRFRGDTVPSIGGAVIVDLSGMKKIIRVDRPNRIAMCEPGVTFRELIPEVEKVGLRLNMPLLPRATKSVVGSLLGREPVIMPGYQWDIADPMDCLEVIFGTGDLFRTGGAAGPGTIEDQLASGGAQDEPLGPGQADWHRAIQGAQGTLGIVTWATMRCELLPKVEEPFFIGSSNLDKIIEMVHWLVRLRLVNECFVLNNSNISTILAKKYPNDYQDLKTPLESWVLFFNIAGYDYFPKERISYQKKDIMDVAQRIGLKPTKKIGKISAHDFLETVQRPSEEPYWKLRSKGACHDIFFMTVYDKLPDLIGVIYSKANAIGYLASDIGVYLQPLVQGSSCHCEFSLFYDPESQAETEGVKNLSISAIKDLLIKGAFFSRPYGRSASMIMNRDAATVSALQKIKRIVDPNNVLNPGKLCF